MTQWAVSFHCKALPFLPQVQGQIIEPNPGGQRWSSAVNSALEQNNRTQVSLGKYIKADMASCSFENSLSPHLLLVSSPSGKWARSTCSHSNWMKELISVRNECQEPLLEGLN
jgi:hypothetical protein